MEYKKKKKKKLAHKKRVDTSGGRSVYCEAKPKQGQLSSASPPHEELSAASMQVEQRYACTPRSKVGRYKRAGVEARTAKRKTHDYSSFKQQLQASESLLR